MRTKEDVWKSPQVGDVISAGNVAAGIAVAVHVVLAVVRDRVYYATQKYRIDHTLRCDVHDCTLETWQQLCSACTVQNVAQPGTDADTIRDALEGRR